MLRVSYKTHYQKNKLSIYNNSCFRQHQFENFTTTKLKCNPNSTTDKESLKHIIDKFNPNLPVEAAHTAPATWYTNPDIAQLEQQFIFRKTWQAIGHTFISEENRTLSKNPSLSSSSSSSDLSSGAYLTGHFIGEPFVCLQGNDNKIRSFYNVCRHKATELLPLSLNPCIGKKSHPIHDSFHHTNQERNDPIENYVYHNSVQNDFGDNETATIGLWQHMFPNDTNEKKSLKSMKRTFACPYHGWEYTLDGRLAKAPRIKGIRDFKARDYGLIPIATDATSVERLLFINFDSSVNDKNRVSVREQFHDGFEAIEERHGPLSNLKFFYRRRYDLKCNWKVFVDNYLDGGYHVPYLHHSLSSQLNDDSYTTSLYSNCVVQKCNSNNNNNNNNNSNNNSNSNNNTEKQNQLDFAERVGKLATYVWFYPNFMMNRYGPFLDTNYVIPIDVDHCQVVFDYYIERDFENSFISNNRNNNNNNNNDNNNNSQEKNMKNYEQFLRESLAASDLVQQEDMTICESVQRGLHSSAYETGRYVPQYQHGEQLFHRLLHKDLKMNFS